MANPWLKHVMITKKNMGKGVLLRDVLKAAKKTYRKTVGVKSVRKSRKSRRAGKKRLSKTKKGRGKTKKGRGKTNKSGRGKKHRNTKRNKRSHIHN